MNTLLQNLWYGEASPFEAPPLHLEKLRELEHLSTRHKDTLLENLSLQNREALEKYDDCQAELLSLSELNAFIKGIRFATQFLMEALQNG